MDISVFKVKILYFSYRYIFNVNIYRFVDRLGLFTFDSLLSFFFINKRMPQLVPFYFVNEITFAFVVIALTVYILSKYILPRFVRLFLSRTFISKLFDRNANI